MNKKLRIPRWQYVLLAIHKAPVHHRYSEKLNRQIKGSRTYLRTVVKRLAKNGLIEIEPMGQKKSLILTEKGLRVATSIMQLRSEFLTS